MTMPAPPDGVELLSAAALGALEPHEQHLVDQWVEHDPQARSELAALRRIAGQLDRSEGPPPAVWARIVAEIDHVEARPASADPDRTTVVPLVVPLRPHRHTGRVVRIAAIAATFAALAGTAVALTGGQDDSSTTAPVASAAVIQHAQEALATPGAQRGTVTSADGTTADVVVLPSGVGYVLRIVRNGLSDAARPLLYALTPNGAVQLARLDHAIPVAFQLPVDTKGLALTNTPVKLSDGPDTASSPAGSANSSGTASTSNSTAGGTAAGGSTASTSGTLIPGISLPITLPITLPLTLPTLPHLP